MANVLDSAARRAPSRATTTTRRAPVPALPSGRAWAGVKNPFPAGYVRAQPPGAAPVGGDGGFQRAVQATNDAIRDSGMDGSSSFRPTNTSPVDDLFRGRPPINPGGGSDNGGGGRGGGGGGVGGGVDPATAEAYKALLASFGQGVGAEYDAYENSMRAAYDPSKVNAIYDQQQQGIVGAAEGGRGRLAPIMQGLDSRASTARTGVNKAMSDTDARLAALQAEYQAQAGQTNQGLNDVMQAFGAGPVQDTGAQSLQNLMANARVANTRSQGVMDASLADRPAVYGGLEADVLSGISRDQTGLESRVAQQRAAGLAQNDQALQQILGQTGIARIQAEQQRQREELELRAKLAEMGISV